MLLAAGSTGLLVGLVLVVRPASTWLLALTPDGTLEPRTASFLDSLAGLIVLAGLLVLGAAASPRLRGAFAAAWRSPGAAVTMPSRWLAVVAALFAAGLRIAVARWADIGLGDDGARVVWLEQWLRDPRPVWSGLWLPAHLYLHALFYLVIRDAVWAGVLLSACAAGGTVWILTRSLESTWGRNAALVGAVAGSLLPISLAYGSNPDVNPVFAFFMVAACGAVVRAARQNSLRWTIVGWACLVTATWMRFDSLPLVPAIAALLWPRRRAVLLFAFAGVMPLLAWNVVNWLATHSRGGVVGVMMKDPALGGSLVSNAFSYMGALWQSATLPVLVLGVMGMLRALIARKGRAWMLLALVHAASLAGAAVILHAGTQPRYFILIAAVFAAYAGVAVAGILEAGRAVGWATVGLAAVLFVVTPPMYPGRNDLWIRRDPELRTLVDEVAQIADGQHVVWVGESAYYYACRIRPPVDRYHGMPRADSDPQEVLSALAGATQAVACVQQAPIALGRWASLVQLAGDVWQIRPDATRGEYRIYTLQRTKLDE